MYLKDQLYMTTLYYEGSLTKAARQLNISQPAMSKWLMDLEHQLNQKLVVRSSSGIVFTKAGYISLRMPRISRRCSGNAQRTICTVTKK